MIAVFAYVFFRTRRFLRFYGMPAGSRWILVVAIPIALLAAFLSRSVWTTGFFIVMHLILGIALFDFLFFLIRLIFFKKKETKGYRVCAKIFGCGVLPLLFVALLLGYGYGNMKDIVKKEYTLTSQKITENYRIVLITDTHYGTIQDKALLQKAVQEINELHPSLVLLGGDLVDEGTSESDMRELFETLGKIESQFGSYYVYGNHDRQPYTDQRTFTNDMLAEAITQNGISILQDECAALGDEVLLVGREDYSSERTTGRAAVEELLDGINSERFLLLLDHQPVTFEESVASGIDLQLSGHTHAGQIFPIGLFLEMTGYNYGLYTEGKSALIVSSGFTGWGYPFRTEGHCEYVVIDLVPDGGEK